MTSLLLFLVLTVLTLPFVCAQLQITTHPSHIDAQLGSTAILNCSFTLEVTPVDPAQVHVIWKKEGTKVLSYMGNMEVQRPGAQLSEQVLTQGDASLTLPNLTRSDSGKYSCSIRLASEQDTQTITLAVNDYRQIWVNGTTVVPNRSNELQCGARNLSSPDIRIEWLRDGELLSMSVPQVVRHTEDQGFLVESSFSLTPSGNDSSAQYSCQIGPFPYPLMKNFWLTFGVPPEVFFYYSIKKKNSSLICLVSGFYPEELSVEIERDGQLLSEKTQKWLNPNGTYSMVATSPFTLHNTDNNIEFTCTIYHPTVPKGSTERMRVFTEPYVPTEALLVVSAVMLLYVLFSLRKRVSKITTCKDWTDSCTVTLKCSITGRYPKTITAVWLIRKGENELEIKERGSVHPARNYIELQEQDSYTCWNTVKSVWVWGLCNSLSSVLCFQVHKDQHEGAEFICRFMRGRTILAERQFSGIVLENYGFYSASEIVVPEECNEGERVTLSCFLRGNIPQETKVMWEQSLDEERMLIPMENDGTIQITENKSKAQLCTFLTICPSQEDSGSVFICSFSEHEGRILAERSSIPLKVSEPKKSSWSKTYQDWGFRAFDEPGITEM